MIYFEFNLFRNRDKGTRAFTRWLFSEGMLVSQAYILLFGERNEPNRSQSIHSLFIHECQIFMLAA